MAKEIGMNGHEEEDKRMNVKAGQWKGKKKGGKRLGRSSVGMSLHLSLKS